MGLDNDQIIGKQPPVQVEEVTPTQLRPVIPL